MILNVAKMLNCQVRQIYQKYLPKKTAQRLLLLRAASGAAGPCFLDLLEVGNDL